MSQTPRSVLTTTRLVSTLQAMGVPGAAPSQRDVVNRFGRMIDLGYSVTLSDCLRQIERASTAPAADSASSADTTHPSEVLLEARRAAIEYVLVSFSTDNKIAMPFRFPAPSAGMLDDPEKAATPYQRFYVLHQSEMDFRFLRLRKAIRESLMGQGYASDHLLMLDDTLNDTLAKHARKALSAVPKLIVHRFVELAKQAATGASNDSSELAAWSAPDGWLGRFRAEIEGLLLAEIDLRLHPLLGLIEAAAAREDDE